MISYNSLIGREIGKCILHLILHTLQRATVHWCFLRVSLSKKGISNVCDNSKSLSNTFFNSVKLSEDPLADSDPPSQRDSSVYSELQVKGVVRTRMPLALSREDTFVKKASGFSNLEFYFSMVTIISLYNTQTMDT